MRRFWLYAAVAVIGAIALTAAACGDDDDDDSASNLSPATSGEDVAAQLANDENLPDKVTIGLIPGENSEEVLKRYEPIEPWLEEQLGIEVDLFIGTDYSATIEALKSRRVDAAFINPFGYILAVDQGAAELVVVPLDPETGEFDHYHSTIVTRADSEIDSLEDLRGKDFGFVDPASTSGHLIPEAGLRAAGFDPWTEMNPVYAGGHDVTTLSVFNGTLPAAAVFGGSDENNPLDGGMIDRLAEAGQVDKSAFKVIWVSDPIPSSPVVVHPDASDAFKQKFKEALLRVQDNPDITEAFGRSFTEGDDSIYDVLREAAKLLDLDLEAAAAEG